ITEQHLQTFKTLDNIIATKRELPDSLPQNGICVTSDNIYTRNLTLACRKVIVGEKDCDYTYSAVLGQDGASMTVNCGGNKQIFHTNLIGYANAQDVAMAYALAQELSLEVSKVNLSTIPQIPHRMELIKTKSFDILDDSYNASIEGVKAIYKTLSALTCKKVVISQGIVEGGDKEKQLNIEVGKLLGECCDCVYTLGRNAKNIAFGVASVGKDVKIVSSLEEAVEKVSHLLKVGDLLIFQNDIPEGV
ncbi:MAG: cyanophycin synthetase, partial [Clostridia bacterium]